MPRFSCTPNAEPKLLLPQRQFFSVWIGPNSNHRVRAITDLKRTVRYHIQRERRPHLQSTAWKDERQHGFLFEEAQSRKAGPQPRERRNRMKYVLHPLKGYGDGAISLAVLPDFRGASLTAIAFLVLAGPVAGRGKMSITLIAFVAAMAATGVAQCERSWKSAARGVVGLTTRNLEKWIGGLP